MEALRIINHKYIASAAAMTAVQRTAGLRLHNYPDTTWRSFRVLATPAPADTDRINIRVRAPINV